MEDKPNDKGDRLILTWDHPIVFVNQTTSLNDKNTRLRVNYTVNKTETQEIERIYFDFFKIGDDQPFTTINEFYQDDKFVLNVPKDYDYKQGFKVKVRIETTPAIPEDENQEIEQILSWDKAMFTLMPEKELYRNGVDISRFLTTVYVRAWVADIAA